MGNIIEFKKSMPFSIGVELEFQLINLNNYNLILESEDFLRRAQAILCEKNIKPEITQSMMEINSSIHSDYRSLLNELNTINSTLLEVAKKMHIGICGGGMHPFQKWNEQKIFKNERFLSVSEQYGFLAKQFTVFGQHIHIGCQNGEDALYLCHALAYYIPHFIALSASSPFNQSIDTSFDCSRLSVISAFPLSGTPPWIFQWSKFHQYFEKLYHLNVVKSIKDFYWDIRPKPEYGTVEIRICDTPLTIQTACDIAFYANCLTRFLLKNRTEISKEVYLTYLINRFRASRFGLDAEIIDAANERQKNLKEDILHTCGQIEGYAEMTGSLESLERIKNIALNGCNGAQLLRSKFSETGALEDVVRFQIDSWSMH
ncbi:MAG: ybdK 2 [Gammaproteobacteria bacterium]|jgi:carboxylate-amine ligase|nr:ybdK 2 [Gammaproteobacteria bacterium]